MGYFIREEGLMYQKHVDMIVREADVTRHTPQQRFKAPFFFLFFFAAQSRVSHRNMILTAISILYRNNSNNHYILWH
jgi:hypothetical protein